MTSASGNISGGGASGMVGQDPTLKHCSSVEGDRNRTICNYCGLLMKNIGITQFKFHLAHRDSHNNTKKVPPEVKEEK